MQVSLFGQSYNMGAAGARTVTGCNLSIYDNGGPTGDYGANRNDTMTILSGAPATPSIVVTLNEGDIATDDSLFIYNSNTADPTKIVFMGPLNAPFFNNSNMIVLGDWRTFATIDNPTGAITLRFKSNDVNTGAGFKISVNCQKHCQQIFAFIDTLATTPTPHSLYPDDGYQYIDVCENETVHFVANAFFADNNTEYFQELDSCTFNWEFNNGIQISEPFGDNIIDQQFQPGHGYNIKLEVKDQRQCYSLNSQNIRIRTSVNPIHQVNLLDTMCSGKTQLVTVGYNDSSDVVLIPISNIENQGVNLEIDSAFFIPDGPNCAGASDCLSLYGNFTSFSAGQTIQSADDILSVCIKMEHSYLGDLNFKVVCPNGTSVMIHSQPNGGGLWLGAPIDDAGGCTPVVANAGIGWNYCWSNYPGYSYHGSSPNYIHQSQTIFCDSTNRAAGSNYYHPMTAFSGLIGCPLNGTWGLEICDLYGIDDGWVFSWDINLDPALSSDPWSYQVNWTDVNWTGPFVAPISDSTALISPSQAGDFNFVFSINDDFGCSYDSVLTLHVNESASADFTYISDASLSTLFTCQSSNAASYLWDFGYASTTSTDENPIFIYPVAGQYTVSLTTTIGQCTNTTTQIISIPNVGINEQNSESITIFPIPTTGKITVQFGSKIMENAQLSVFDITGKMMVNKLITGINSNNSIELDLSSLVAGVYCIRVEDNTNVINKAIVIER